MENEKISVNIPNNISINKNLIVQFINSISDAINKSPNKEYNVMVLKRALENIEIDKRIFSLACANMLIHKDGKTNLEQMDSTSQEACDWIKSKGITKVLMNPPYERKCHPD